METQEKYLSLFDIYNKFPFEWALVSDFIKWQSDAHLLLANMAPFETGDRYANRMNVADFEKRVQALHEHRVAQTAFDLDYQIYLENDQVCEVQEKSELVMSPQGYPALFRGTLKCLSPPASSVEQKKGRQRKTDTTTRLLNRHTLLQELETLLKPNEDADEDAKPTSKAVFLQIHINRLFQIGIQYGFEEVQNVLKKVSKEFKNSIRKTDKIGRLSGNSFGIILFDCDQFALVVVAKKIIEAIEFAGIRAHDSNIPVQIAIGGSVLQSNSGATSAQVLEHSERVLTDAINIKKMAVPSVYIRQPSQDDAKHDHDRRHGDQKTEESDQ